MSGNPPHQTSVITGGENKELHLKKYMRKYMRKVKKRK